MTAAVTTTIYASEQSEDIDVRVSFGWATIESEDGALLFLSEDDIRDLTTRCESTVDAEDEGRDNCITLELEQLQKLQKLF